MSLFSWGARVAFQKWAGDAEKGKKGAAMQGAISWLKKNKGPIGLGLGVVYAVGMYLDPTLPQAHYVVGVLDKAVPFLLGAGFLESDIRHRQAAAK